MQKILLLHGALGSAENFGALEKVLSTHFQVYTFTFEGHGGREIPAHSFSIARFADEVLAFLAKNEIERISIFGYSMGGYVGLYLAKYFPEKIDQLFTLATKLDWTLAGATKEASMLNPTKIKEKVPKYADMMAKLHGENWEILMEKTAEMIVSLGEKPVLEWADFELINTPSYLAVGDKDVMVSVEETQKAAQLLQKGHFISIQDTFHPWEKVNMEDLSQHICNSFR